MPLLEAATVADPSDKQILDATLNGANGEATSLGDTINGNLFPDAEETAAAITEPDIAAATTLTETPATDPFETIPSPAGSDRAVAVPADP